MSVTPQFIDQLRERVPISDVVGRFVTWDQGKSRPAQGDYWAPCPFHSEKTASFHADDRKGFYYCFGCHAKGDAINFLKEKTNLEFMDAVRELASMAGVEMPQSDPRAKEKSDANSRLIAMHENAARYFALQLQTAAGAQARDYLHKRGLTQKTIEEFGIGLIPNARDLLLTHLRDAGYKDQEILEAGLALKPDDGGANFDRFRNRIMFPIHDGRKRVVAFGGRAIDPNARAKYLNSADSPIFHKGRLVYNFARAREALKRGEHFIIVEGYMDVIALSQAGFKAAVAPMGTAITLDQIELLWRIDPAPLMALDGDKAGQAAAIRAANLVLPRLSAERSLRFLIMPEGQDPDDLIQAKGANAFGKLMKQALPLVDVLWQAALGDEPLETPEARAAFDGRLKAIANQIEDPSLKSHYMAEFRERRNALWQSSKSEKQGKRFEIKTAPNVTQLPPPKAGYGDELRVAIILRTILNNPEIGKRLTDDLSVLACPNASLDRLRKEVIMAYGDKDALQGLATEENFAKLEFGQIMQNLRFLTDEESASRALDVVSDDVSRAVLRARAQEEINGILADLQQNELTEEKEAMLRNAVILRDQARKIMDENMDDDQDKRAFLRQFLESERWHK